MRHRFFGPAGLCCAFAGVAALVIGGLAWVTVASLDVEKAQAETTVRADRANQERLALWRLDGQLLPTLGLENNRPYSHYTALHAPYPAVDTEQEVFAPGTLRLPSPLLSADLPNWQVLHFQIDAESGWQSPQVLSQELAERLRAAPLNLVLNNVSIERDQRLADLRKKFPASDVIRTLAEAEQATPDESPFYVPVPFLNETAVPKPAFQAGDVEPVESRPLGRETLETKSLGLERKSRPAMVGTGRGGATDDGSRAGGFGGGAPGPGGMPAPARKAEQVPATGAAGDVPRQASAPPAPPAVAAAQTPAPAQQLNNQYAQQPYNFSKGGQPSADFFNEKIKEAKEFNARLLATKNSSGMRGGLDGNNALRTVAPGAPQVLGAVASDKAGEGQLRYAPGPAAPGGPPPSDPKSMVPAAEGGKDAKKYAESKDEDRKRDALAKENAEKRLLPNEQKQGLGKADPAKLDEDLRKNGEGESAKDVPAGALMKAQDNAGQARDKQLSDLLQVLAPGSKKAGPTVQPVAVHIGPIRPHWLTASDGSEILVLVRAARLDNRTVYQGALLDWAKLHEMLREQISEMFPHATLSPVRTVAELSPERAMTALPVQLDPGPAPQPPATGYTPLRVGLTLAWAAALLALAAVGFGGRALVSLSERRIRFVSAVTHELRTPLTSLRLYLDLLNSGMIEDEAKQKEYLRTLGNESDRLYRLVENVLDFARLEKRSDVATMQPTGIELLLDEVSRTWTDRCATDEMELVVISTMPAGQSVTTDVRMAAQVLGNLVDNARKYARSAEDRRIWLWAKPGERGKVLFEVEDRGPGVPAGECGTVFKAFRRGKAADTIAGGAGLGLALARQWADLIGGKLSYRTADGGVGACFRLELPS